MKKTLMIFVIAFLFTMGINVVNADPLPTAHLTCSTNSGDSGNKINVGDTVTCETDSPNATLTCGGAGAYATSTTGSISCKATTISDMTVSAGNPLYYTSAIQTYSISTDSSGNEVDVTPYAACEDFKDLTRDAWFIIRVAAPVLLLVFGAIDFAKATMAEDEKQIKKATSDFVKRLVICICIFFLPTVVDLIVGLMNYGQLTACM